MAIDFNQAAIQQATSDLAITLQRELARELRAALQPVFDKVVQDALTKTLGALHASVAEYTDRCAMAHVTVLRVDGVEKARLG